MNATLRQHYVSRDAVRAHPAGTFKTMAEDSIIIRTVLNTDDGNNKAINNSGDGKTRRRLSYSSENDVSKQEETACKVLTLQNVPDDSKSCRLSAEMAGELSPLPQDVNSSSNTRNVKDLSDFSSGVKQQSADSTEDKENSAVASTNSSSDDTREAGTSGQRNLQDCSVTASKQHVDTEDRDADVMRRAQQEGLVNVVFPGTVTQEGCCRFVSEILKCILYQRQQLPMTYDQLVYSQKKQQASAQDSVTRRPSQSEDMDWRKCQQTLQELEEVLQQLEVLFSISRVPRVLLLMGGSVVLPKELYEINMEHLEVAAGDQCLRVSSCLRQLFRTLFVADLLSDSKPVRLMPTTVLVLAHRDCGVEWFRPKLQFKVPTRVKNQVIALSSTGQTLRAEGSDWEDYVWFQAPMTIKGFGK